MFVFFIHIWEYFSFHTPSISYLFVVVCIGQNTSYIAPTQIIAIASRIAASELKKEKKSIPYQRKLTVEDFQERIRDKNYKKKLSELIGNEKNDGLLVAVFSKAIKILSLEQNENLHFPKILIKDFVNNSSELFFFLIYWLLKNNITISKDDEIKIVGRLLYFSWFSMPKQKNKTIKTLWVNESLTNKDFWKQPLTELADGYLIPLVPPGLLRNYFKNDTVRDKVLNFKDETPESFQQSTGAGKEIKNYYLKTWPEMANNFKKDSDECYSKFEAFITALFGSGNKNGCRSMILFAQRDYIRRIFTDYNQFDDLEDTNVPWDWDHIYPTNWTKSEKGNNLRKYKSIIKLNNCIGNIRALSLSENREQQDNLAPSERLDDKIEMNSEIIKNLGGVKGISFIKMNDWQYWDKIKEPNADNKKNHYEAVITRAINIYEEWWVKFSIADIFKIAKKYL
jgi:hypothetical protein